MLTAEQEAAIFGVPGAFTNIQSNLVFWPREQSRAMATQGAIDDENKRRQRGTPSAVYWQHPVLLVEDLPAVAASARRQGIGRQLMEIAEKEAIARGCKYAFVDTIDYQSPAFYQKLGYQMAGRIPDWDSHGHAKCFLMKGLRNGTS